MKNRVISFAALCLLCASACKSSDSSADKKTHTKRPATPVKAVPKAKPKAARVPLHERAPWFQGSVEAAMAAAKKQGKPIFLYWGAVWCPPCNALKAAVFSKPEFAGAMTKFVSVYLDGDTDRAQAWGEKLSVSGYPTLLFLDPSGREVLRSSAGMTWAEFVALKDSVLARMKPLKDVIALARAGKAKPGDWKLLASVDSYGLKTRGKRPAEIIELLSWIAGAIPADMAEARATAASNLLAAAATTDDKAAAKLVAQVRKHADKYLAAMFTNDDTIKAARENLLYYSAEVVKFAATDAKARAALSQRWLAGVRKLRARTDLPAVTLMDTLWPEIDLYRLSKPKGDVPPALRKLVVDEVGTYVARLKTPYERKSGVSDATQLLRKVGAFDQARKLLDAELKTTSTPWYYMSSYANLEKTAGNQKAALDWAKKARLAAKGGATKLQWIANDLSMTSAAKGSAHTERMVELVKLFYAKLLSLPDGFKGRNHRVAKRVAKKIHAWNQRNKVESLLTGFAARCAKVAAAQRPVCKKYFEQLLARKKS